VGSARHQHSHRPDGERFDRTSSGGTTHSCAGSTGTVPFYDEALTQGAAESSRVEQGLTAPTAPQAEESTLLTIEQVARHLNVSKATIKRAILRGHLKAADITERSTGGKHRPNYRVQMEWVDEYVQSRLIPVIPATTHRASHRAAETGRDYLK